MNPIYICSMSINGKKKTLDMVLTEDETAFKTLFCKKEVQPYLDEKYKVTIRFQSFKP